MLCANCYCSMLILKIAYREIAYKIFNVLHITYICTTFLFSSLHFAQVHCKSLFYIKVNFSKCVSHFRKILYYFLIIKLYVLFKDKNIFLFIKLKCILIVFKLIV